jgi:hypothetical protein
MTVYVVIYYLHFEVKFDYLFCQKAVLVFKLFRCFVATVLVPVKDGVYWCF